MNPPKSSRPDGLLTYADLAAHNGCHVKTIQRWASKQRPISQRLRTIHLSPRTVVVRPSEWVRFVESGETVKGY